MATFNQEKNVFKGAFKPKVVTIKKLNKFEELFASQLRAYNISFQREYVFHPDRKWRFDFALGNNIAVEIEGGIWTNGAHVRGKHFESDTIKYAEAILCGWKVFRFSTDQIKSGIAINYIKKALA